MLQVGWLGCYSGKEIMKTMRWSFVTQLLLWWKFVQLCNYPLSSQIHGNILGQPISISFHILMATPRGNPLPSHPTFSWQHCGATHFHLIPHSHGNNTLGRPTSISSHILMATSWGNPLPSPKEKQMKWMLLYYGKGWYSQFHLGNILSLVRQDADPWVWVVTNCTRTLFPSITSVPHHWFISQSGRGRKPKGEKKSLSKCLNKASKAVI